jgi:hypothetical protein
LESIIIRLGYDLERFEQVKGTDATGNSGFIVKDDDESYKNNFDKV